MDLAGGDVSLDSALVQYQDAWQNLLQGEASLLLQGLVPTTISWKVADKTVLYSNLAKLASRIEQVHIGTVNDRYIASASLREAYQGMYILKILERRTSSDDPLGLDSLDYLVEDIDRLFKTLSQHDVNVERQANEMHAWLSLRFGDQNQFEAKFTDHIVLDVACKELMLTNKQLLEHYAKPIN